METLLALHGFFICTCSLKGICSSYSLALFSTFVNTNVHHIHTVSQLSVCVNEIMCIHVPVENVYIKDNLGALFVLF